MVMVMVGGVQLTCVW